MNLALVAIVVAAAVLTVAAVAVIVVAMLRVVDRRMGAVTPLGDAGIATDLAVTQAVIDQQLGQVAERLGAFERTVRELDGHRQREWGALATTMQSLSQTTQQLRDALGSAKSRGQWGERMADDVLRAAGFVEGVNYRKQRAIANGAIPDFTFLLPNDLVLHMDVKFPLDNYVRFLDAADEAAREQCRRAFLRDVRDRVKELAGRSYLDDRAATVDCLLLFVPNESLFGFVQEHAPRLLDDAMALGVVVCSPLTLFAILRVIRQAVDHFRLERTASEILALLGEFDVQWARYSEKLDKLQKTFGVAQRDLDELVSTRTRQLQKPLDRIAVLRAAAHGEAALDGGGEHLVLDGEPAHPARALNVVRGR